MEYMNIDTWISSASSDMSASLPRNILSADKKSFSFPFLAWNHWLIYFTLRIYVNKPTYTIMDRYTAFLLAI